MKKRFLLASAAALIMAANVSAQDITPDNYKFSDLEKGSFNIEGVCYGKANAMNNVAELKDPFAAEEGSTKAANFDSFKGLVVVEKWTGEDTEYKTTGDDALEALRTGANIIDLGGEVGKVLCICGSESDWTPGQATGNGALTGDIAFLLKSEGGVNTRVKIVYQQYSKSKISDKTTKGLKFMMKTSGGVAKPNGNGIQMTTYNDFAKNITPDEWEETWVMDDTKWASIEFDYSAGTAFPFRIPLTLPTADEVLLIKEISINQGSDGSLATDPKLEWETFTPATSVNDALAELDKVAVIVNGNMVSISKLNVGENVAIYNINGSLISSFIATDAYAQITLEKGLYVVKAVNGIAKILIK